MNLDAAKIAGPQPDADKPAFLNAAGARIAYRRAGAGPPILCLHATGHDSLDFSALARRLGGEFEFIALDWPGQGESPHDEAPASAARYGDILAAVIEALKLEHFVILGNSIGGAAAIIYAAMRPERVRGLVLCDPGGLQQVNFIARFICRRMADFFRAGERGDKNFPRKYRRYYETMVLPAPAATERREEIIAAGPRSARALREAWESFAKPEAYLGELAPRIACPTFYAWAKGDKLITWGRSKRAGTKISHYEIQFFQGGHAAFLEAPDAFDAALRKFLAKLPN